MAPLTFHALHVAALTVVGEARGEPPMGALGVAYVLVNRAEAGIHGSSLAEVALAPWQFSSWNNDDPNLRIMASIDTDSGAYIAALGAVLAAVLRLVPDPTEGATDYHTVEAPQGIHDWPPAWVKDYIPTVKLGSQQFYKRHP